MNKEIIKLSKISKKYETNNKKISVLRSINLKINRGELISLNGPSGSGKSTLLHIIALLDKPTSGEVFFKKKSFTKANDKEKDLVRKKGISIIYQQNNLLSDFSALENVALPLLNNHFSWKDAKKKAKEMLSLVNLSKRFSHFPSELSGGEQQRISIARAFVNRPLILLADEPTGNLDPATSVGIMRLLDRINRSGTTVVMATHDRGIVDTMRRRVIELDRGMLVRDESRGVYE